MATYNSAEYSWCDIELVLQGRKITGLRGISYKTSQEKEHIFGAGSEPVAIGRGNKKYEGEITLLQSEYEALVRAAGRGKDVTDLRGMDIVIAYVPQDGGQIVTDIVKYAEFTESEKGWKQGDKYIEVKLPFLALGIEKNVL
jgi:hypothetical protein